MTDIKIHIAHKSYHQNSPAIIENFALTLLKNEFVCLFGQSGCGKTTLLNCIAGLNTDYQGEIQLGEKHSRAKIAYVFQSPRLLPWRTVRENIELVLNKEQLAIIDELLAVMQLTQVQNEYPKSLSQGMQRKVSIIRAFAVNPDILLMDEHSVALDAPMIRDIRQLLMRLWQQRPHTVLFVTHDLREAITLADRLIFLAAKPMRIVQDIKVTIARDERDNETLIEAFRQQLLTDYSQIQSLL
ncbi:MAG: ABC transporter ATP-binding protein [Methylococcaceae bacterium]